MPETNIILPDAGGEELSTYDSYRAGNMPSDMAMMIRMVMAVRGFRACMDERLRRIGQSVSRMETLGAIVNMPGRRSQTEIAKRLRVEGATVTRMVDSLSREGLVERHPDPADRRVNLLSITPAGEEALRQMFAIHDDLRIEVLGDIPQADRAELRRMLDLMLARIDALDS
jgi:MarR family transcriptional regulator for hemolysin